jgi:hypothetical protein
MLASLSVNNSRDVLCSSVSCATHRFLDMTNGLLNIFILTESTAVRPTSSLKHPRPKGQSWNGGAGFHATLYFTLLYENQT